MWSAREGQRGREVASALDRHYAPVLAGCRTTWAVQPESRAVVLLTGAGSAPTLPLVWGLPVGADGEATDAELDRLVADPTPDTHLLGSFVLVAAVAGGLRIVTGADLMHTLARVESGEDRTWSTKGWAALIAAGRPARLERSRIPEYVVFDQVFGGDELLAGPKTLPEAWQVDLRAGAVEEGSWWPAPARMGPGPPTTGPELRRCLVDELGRLARAGDLHLGLTAGRDSTLAAVALAEANARAATYTFGDPSWPDVRAARSTAATLGLEHRMWTAPPPEPPSLERAVARTAWTEGLDTAANLVHPSLVWDGPPDVLLLSGNGGETGRAFYYGARPVPATPDGVVELLAGGLLSVLPGATADGLRSRLLAAMEVASDVAGGCGPRALDVLYATTRMRSWLARTAPPAHARATLAAFTSPGVTRILLDLPEPARRDGSGFDAALAADGLALLRAVAPARVPVADRLNRAVTARAGRVRGAHRAARLTRRWTSVVDRESVDTLRGLFDAAGTAAVREVMGERWWHSVWDDAAYRPDARRQLWNALAVDVLARVASA